MGSKVILADDSVTIQKVVGIIFANEGYDLTVVPSGDAAVAKAREIQPDVMLVDALMPGKNGYEVCREIRRDPALAATAILLMTGAFETVDEEEGRRSGADEFITKPFESQVLIEATNRLIALTAQRRAAAPAVAPAAAPAAAVPPPQATVPPIAAPPPVAPAAANVDDIWATGFDEEPAAAPAAAPAMAPAAAAPAPANDDIWATGFDDEPAAVEPVAAPAAPAAPQPVAAAPSDDIWGAFDMDAFETAPAPTAPAAAMAAPAAAELDTFSFETTAPAAPSVDTFAFETETPAAADDAFVLEEAFAEPEATTGGFETFGEQEFSFGEASEPAVAPPVVSPAVEEDFSTISFDEPEPTPAAASMPVDDAFAEISFAEPAAPEAAPVVAPPVPPPLAASVPPVAVAAEPVAAPQPPPAPPVAPAPVVAAPVAPLGEEQLRTLLSQVSREVIERIVWEVVPDLAETIIKEEIRKLKAGTA